MKIYSKEELNILCVAQARQKIYTDQFQNFKIEQKQTEMKSET